VTIFKKQLKTNPMLKKILIGLLFIAAILQFIRPARNQGELEGPQYIGRSFPVPADVRSILVRSCFDCHSNRTEYPWYASVQPLGWWLQQHVDEGKEELNFSEFLSYSAKRQQKKMHEVAEVLQEGEMPLSSYLIVHRDAKLSAAEQNTLIAWAKSFGGNNAGTAAAEEEGEKE
jgi:hypothetical protein